MKRAFIFFIEEIGYGMLMTYAFLHFPEHFEGIRVTAVFLILMLSIAAVNLFQFFLESKVKSAIATKYGMIGELIYHAIALAITTLVFFGFYIALEHIGNMPASIRTLMIISFLSATVHLVFGEFPKIMTVSEESESWEDDEFED